MGLVEHAEFEMRHWLALPDDDPQRWIADGTMALIREFASQGHSGSSAPYAVSVFQALASYQPLGPLTGEDDEWNEVGHGIFQNRRCSHVFKEGGQAYDNNGRVFREPSGSCYTSADSRVPVTFPYTPSTEYVDVIELGGESGHD